MEVYDHFPSEVHKEIGYYVYRLIDPRNGNTFYVGKGTGDRVFAHAKGALKESDYEKDEDAETNDPKSSVIREIIDSGLDVIYVIQRWGMDEKTAFEVESALIDSYPGLTNKVKGHSHDRGACNVHDLIQQFKREIYAEPDFPYVLIKTTQERIDQIVKEKGVDLERATYLATHYAWKLKFEKAKKYQYVISTVDGIVKAVYRVKEWYPVEDRAPRIGFDGDRAEEKIWAALVNKRVPDNYRVKGMASPALYSKNMEP